MASDPTTNDHAPQSRLEPADGPAVAEVPRLALRPAEAAMALGIGESLLWTKTNAGEIPSVKFGRRTVYPTDQLREWLAEQARLK